MLLCLESLHALLLAEKDVKRAADKVGNKLVAVFQSFGYTMALQP